MIFWERTIQWWWICQVDVGLHGILTNLAATQPAWDSSLCPTARSLENHVLSFEIVEIFVTHLLRWEGHLSSPYCLVQPTKELRSWNFFKKPSDDLWSVLILRAGKRVKKPGKPLQGKSPPAEPLQPGLSPFVGCCARRGLYIIQNLVSIRFLDVELKKRPIVVWKNKEFYHESSTISGSLEECGKRLPLPLWLNRVSPKSLHDVFFWKVIRFQ